MAHPHVTMQPGPAGIPPAAGEELRTAFARIRAEHEIPGEFPEPVQSESERIATGLTLPERDERAVEFVTIDPEGSMDLDQALCIEPSEDGYRVRYAIADVPGIVPHDGEIAAEALRRGLTVYCPDERSPLHPPVLSEGAASLLPEEDRPALVWDLLLDGAGRLQQTDLYRAAVRSRRRYTYVEAQAAIDDGTAEQNLALLREVGEHRIALERERGGATLPMPEQVVEQDGEGFTLQFRPLLPAEDWNAQISLLAGMAAAELMLRGGIGILRTMPDPEPQDVDRLRRQARALDVQWADDQDYGDFLATLDPANGLHLYLVHESTMLFRGAGYTVFDGAAPEVDSHSAIAAPYAHVTAPLRRLVDRYGLEICLALAAGEEVPAWLREALPTVPEVMQEADQRAKAVERACVDAVEAAALAPHAGEEFEATAVDVQPEKQRVEVQLLNPAVIERASGVAEPGQTVRVRLEAASVAEGTVELTVL
ncbi:RNB domain-containing protein [Kytococcus aerolatus]|uniref:RNB domain-containing protein n=1 Tax=Kytococcus aerolatus TaxID=592308 RepID=A0A212U2Z9_9MICO|nr:RNB domain-containing ribonuclease [Kytococcus aerolatus]SNC72491.1 RNB domain-containing protein [Kytococcus aerolatus]